MPGLKVKARHERASDAGDIERYERLRRSALGGEAEGWRLGLALLERCGVAAWARAWETTAPVDSPRPARTAAEPSAGSEEIVGVLATMALACLAGK